MKLKSFLATYALAKGIAKYRHNKQCGKADNNEKCENYYRCDDEENDGRGSY